MIDYSLYLVTDSHLSLGRTTAEVVASAVKGGVSCVQLREKNLTKHEFLDNAQILKELLAPLGIPLIINDYPDIALAVNAEGVHLGQNDMPVREARDLLGKNKLIGISAECLEDAIRAEQQGADYIGVSPVFATTSKADTGMPLGLAGIRRIRRHVRLPLVAIGGITSMNTGRVIAAGADGIAVISAIVSAASPEESARMLTELIAEARRVHHDCN